MHNKSHQSDFNANAPARSGVAHEVKSFLADIEDLVKETTSLTGDDLARAKVKLTERVSAAKQSVEDMGSDIAQRARKSAKATDDYVREQPWKAIGAGAAVAFLLGFVLARRN
jgi:ElaB/YqjD/DUF883 family membrane-anchored ribosome-binding protein